VRAIALAFFTLDVDQCLFARLEKWLLNERRRLRGKRWKFRMGSERHRHNRSLKIGDRLGGLFGNQRLNSKSPGPSPVLTQLRHCMPGAKPVHAYAYKMSHAYIYML
jgi:hypothetical protein